MVYLCSAFELALFSNHSAAKQEQNIFRLDMMNAEKNQEQASRLLIARLYVQSAEIVALQISEDAKLL